MKPFNQHLTEMKLQLQYHDTLNPKLWDGEKLKPEVRAKLLHFGDTWRAFANIPRRAVKDILMLGGNANYNYTEKSDIDVHLVVDKQLIAANNPLLDDYLQDKKVMWTQSHNVTILGYGLEPYAQDESVTAKENQGVYSLKSNKWLVKPKYIGDDMLKDPQLKRKVRFYMKMIDDMMRAHADQTSFKNLKDKLRDMRGAAILAGGEFSFENLVFKELRNRGYLDKMSRYSKQLQDQSLSL
jgi:hypothetical protein